MGIVRAFGKQDLDGRGAGVAAGGRSSRPNSPEGQAAKQALDGMKSAHPDAEHGRAAQRPAAD